MSIFFRCVEAAVGVSPARHPLQPLTLPNCALSPSGQGDLLHYLVRSWWLSSPACLVIVTYLTKLSSLEDVFPILSHHSNLSHLALWQPHVWSWWPILIPCPVLVTYFTIMSWWPIFLLCVWSWWSALLFYLVMVTCLAILSSHGDLSCYLAWSWWPSLLSCLVMMTYLHTLSGHHDLHCYLVWSCDLLCYLTSSSATLSAQSVTVWMGLAPPTCQTQSSKWPKGPNAQRMSHQSTASTTHCLNAGHRA